MLKKIWLAAAILIISPVMMFFIDYRLACSDSPPFFAIRTNLLKDGGTSIYHGLGYKVIDYNQADGRKDVVFQSVLVSRGVE